MCGIVGYIGKKNAIEIGLEGLKRLEYRGYDSAGAVVCTSGGLKRIRAAGKIAKLEKKLKGKNLKGSPVLLHTRWATHGLVNETNAHPHTDCNDNIFLVHNGIIENHRLLKIKLQDKGHIFKSETDTEVLSHLIEHFFSGSLEDAVRKALKYVRGAYGLAVISRDDPKKIVAARMFSPVLVSVNASGGFVASDPAAIVTYSKRIVFLEDGDIATITEKNLTIANLKNEDKKREETELDWNIEEAQKGGYEHFMLKEIMEQPEAIANTIAGRVISTEGIVKLGGLESVEKQLKKAEKINIIACGTSYYAGLTGKYFLEEIAGVKAQVETASEFRYGNNIINKEEPYLFLSQSGETADTLAALKMVKANKGIALGIVNVVGSSIARETDAGIYNHIGPEISVASTKAFTSQVTLLLLLSLYLGQDRLLRSERKKIIDGLIALPQLAGETLSSCHRVEKIAQKYKDFSNFLFIGRRYGYPLALEGALKLKEISYIHAEGYAAGEMKHGPLALIDKKFPTVALCPQGKVYDKMISNIRETKSRNGPIIVLSSRGDEEVGELTEDVVYLPLVRDIFSPILFALPLQLFAYHMAKEKGRDIDQPRNLAKSVTVE